jgi:hypothetical protein
VVDWTQLTVGKAAKCVDKLGDVAGHDVILFAKVEIRGLRTPDWFHHGKVT